MADLEGRGILQVSLQEYEKEITPGIGQIGGQIGAPG
jgi:hypothetical protein